MSAIELITELFSKGLGELLVLHVRKDDACLGNVVLEKGRLIIRDQGMLAGFKPSQFAQCSEDGVLGMVTAAKNQVWESLTFIGLKHCDVPVDLSRTRHGALEAAHNQYGESLIHFIGSIYRGYQLMLDHHFLPVVLMKEMRSKEGQSGLAVCDLRVVPMDLAVIRKINDVVRKSVEKQLSLEVQDMEVFSEEFDKLFPEHMTEPKAVMRSRPDTPATAAPEPNRGRPAVKPDAETGRSPAPAARSAGTPVARPNAAPAVQERKPQVEQNRRLDDLAPVIRFLKLVAGEFGEARAFEMFERWASEFVASEVRLMLERNQVEGPSPRQFYDAVSVHFERFGERYTTIEESADRIVHEIHGCMYRQACLRVGGINMDKWGTCMQVIPVVRSKAAALADPNLEWVWNRCDRRSEHPCLYEIRKRAADS